jgi:hypothetical protein
MSESQDTSPAAEYYPEQLAAAETALIDERRGQCSVPAKSGHIGVGLSGGGIRSAIFSLGVFQALSRTYAGTVGLETKPPPAAQQPDEKPTQPAKLLERIDFLSTVSGGGYFGSFLGRLYSRNWIKTPEDVARVLTGISPPPEGERSFRFLRDNGRYLAPRGSGDVLTVLAITLRNWLAVQMTFIIAALAAFVLIRLIDIIVPELPFARVGLPIWWSRWFLLIPPITVLWTLPACWAFWVIGQPLSQRALLRRSDVIVLAVLVGVWFLHGIPPTVSVFAALVAISAIATFGFSLASNFSGVLDWLGLLAGIIDRGVAAKDVVLARSRLTRWLKRSLVATAIVAVIAFVDSVGATAYAVIKTTGGLTTATSSVVALLTGFAGIAAYGRQLLVLLGASGSRGKHPPISLSVITWVAAVVVIGAWLIAVSTAAHAIGWEFARPPYAAQVLPPPKLVASEDVRISDARAIGIERGVGADIVRPLVPAAPTASEAKRADWQFPLEIFLFLAGLTMVVGSNRTFLNLSTLQSFYSQQLTRAYLGASNAKRLAARAYVTAVMEDDDLESDRYWKWPQPLQPPPGKITAFFQSLLRKRISAEKQLQAAPPAISSKGGPLHLVNVTVNETYDNRTGMQHQDRKGVPLAVGPAGLSVAARHHLVADAQKGFIALPATSPGSYSVFAHDDLTAAPEVLSLGRWAGISGAAFSSAMGAGTTVPIALLATFANVRLGYWWNSGLDRRPWRFLPVYRGLLAESTARLEGTATQLWNLSDGGHFENLAGYELIRRRLPLIILIDAEADPDFEFPSLAGLVRKARLDFSAEITFLDERPEHGIGKTWLNGDGSIKEPRYIQDLPKELRGIFTSLARIRRGSWNNDAAGGKGASISADGNRQQYSHAHAAIAKVTYADDSRYSWLVYVKASVTGTEPVDVLEYHARHNDFPHETTTDQFFDEAQWESYRRLGEHVGAQVLKPAVFDLALR